LLSINFTIQVETNLLLFLLDKSIVHLLYQASSF